MNDKKPPLPRYPRWLYGEGVFRILTPTQLILFGYLCHRAHVNKRDCWPAIKTIREETGIATETMARAFKVFKTAGMITITKITMEKPVYARRKSKRSNYYEILDEKSPAEIAHMKQTLTAANYGYIERRERYSNFYKKSTLKPKSSPHKSAVIPGNSRKDSTLKSKSLDSTLKPKSSHSTLKPKSSYIKKLDKKQDTKETLKESHKIHNLSKNEKDIIAAAENKRRKLAAEEMKRQRTTEENKIYKKAIDGINN